MKQLAENIWWFFLAAMFFGIWLIPLLIVVFIIYVIIYAKWPEFFKMYL